MKNKFNILLIISAGIVGYIMTKDDGYSNILSISVFILFASTWWLAIYSLETTN